MKNNELRRQAAGISVGFIVEFILGMLLNLFVTIPKNHPGSQGSSYSGRSTHSLGWILSDKGGWKLSVHVYLAILLILGTVSLLVRAIHLQNSYWIKISIVAVLGTVGAFFNGLGYVDFNENVSSFIMAMCWLLAFGALLYGLIFESVQVQKQKTKR